MSQATMAIYLTYGTQNDRQELNDITRQGRDIRTELTMSTGECSQLRYRCSELTFDVDSRVHNNVSAMCLESL